MSLYQRYRPNSFDDVAGAKNKATVETLRKVVASADPPHAYLIHGPRGCGKTTLGRIVGRELGCSDLDFVEVDSADFRGVDAVRDIRRNSQYKGVNSGRRVWLLDECHKMTNDAMNALLKGLEDPPAHAYFVLCTTDPEKLLPTVRSRCSAFLVHQLAPDEMLRLLARIAAKEDAQLGRPALQAIVDRAGGHCRDAIQMLELVIADPNAALDSFETSRAKTIDLCRALIQGNGWKAVASIIVDLKDEDVEQVRRAVIGYCSAILSKEENDRAGEVLSEFVEPFYNSGWPGFILSAYTVVRAG